MVPLDIPTMEIRQFGLLIKRVGADPRAFKLRKFFHRDEKRTTVHVHGRGAATVYEVSDSRSWAVQFAYDLARGLFGLRPPAEPSVQTRQVLGLVEEQLAAGGIPGALRFLNERVPHRLTAIYRLDGDMLRRVALATKEKNLEKRALQEIRLCDSFCQFALKDGVFLTFEAAADSRLEGHPYSGILGCYAGVPITGKLGTYGTLCHFDFRNHEVADEEILFLERAAQLFPRYLQT